MKMFNENMSLLLKPTEICNFSCTFCSSTDLVEDKATKLETEAIFKFLKRFPNTKNIFVVGGDPLIMSPKWYEEILKFLDDNNYKTRLALTTNLWDWYKKPEKWDKIFRHPKVEVGTSFQYGEGRQIRPGKVLTEEIFVDMFHKFAQTFPEKPPLSFIAVINEENEHRALDHLRLAKFLGTECRLNYANKSGRSTKAYPLSKMYQIYLQAWKEGLLDYELTPLSISETLSGVDTGCPISRTCDFRMRSINPDGRYFTCGPFNDDLDESDEVDWESEVEKGEKFYTPLQNHKEYDVLKMECYGCDMFSLCNGCRKHIKDLKQDDVVEEHCTRMKGIASELKEMQKSTEVREMIGRIKAKDIENEGDFYEVSSRQGEMR